MSTWAALAALGLAALLVWVAGDLLGLAVFGAGLAYLLVPLVDALERRGVRRELGTAAVVFGLLVVLGGIAALAVPVLSQQVESLVAQWQNGELTQILVDAERALADHLPFIEPGQLGLVDAIRQAADSDTGPLIEYVPDVLTAIGNAVIVPFVLFALLKDGPVLRRRLLAAVPNRYFEFAMAVAYKADAHLGGYLRGQALIALLVGSSTALGLGILGVDYYLVLGLITGIANFVPYIGFVISAGLAVGVSVVTSGGMEEAAWVVALFLALQTIENVVFQPWITGKNVAMHPVVVLLAILVGGRIGGVLGMALAVPVAAVLKVVIVETAVSLRRYHL